MCVWIRVLKILSILCTLLEEHSLWEIVEKWKMYNIGGCEGGIKLEYMATKSVDESDLNTIIKHIVVYLDNW